MTDMERLEFFKHEPVILQKCKMKEPLLLTAPTGSGKTIGIRNVVLKNRNIFGKTIMVEPTRIATRSLQSIGNLVMTTASQLVETFLYNKNNFPCKTLVMDEIHTRTVEYHTLLSFITKKRIYERIKIILISATADEEYLLQFFPIQRYHIPVQSPYPINILYKENNSYGFISVISMMPEIKKILQEHPGHNRVLVFVYTHEQCERLANNMKEMVSYYNNGKTFALYGGMMKEDVDTWTEFLEQENQFVVFSTNVAETSITIPNLSLIIDFGIQCAQEGCRIIYKHCTKASLEQRAGRTGRTCPGTVVRYMSYSDFESRPIQDTPQFNWDLIVLRILKYNIDPVLLLPIEVDVISIMDKFKCYGILDNQCRVQMPITKFVLESPLMLKNSCSLYKFLQSNWNMDKFILFVIAIALVDCCESRMIRIYYYMRTRKLTRTRFIDFLRYTFASHNDELELHLNILISCMIYDTPVKFSNAFSLNFRALRQISASVHKTFQYCTKYLKRPSIEWKQAMMVSILYEQEDMKDLQKKEYYPIRKITPSAMNMLQTEFFKIITIPQFLSKTDIYYRKNFVPEFYNCIMSPFYSNYNSCPFGVLPLGFDDSNIAKWLNRQNILEEPIIISFTMFTLFPLHINKFLYDLRTNIIVEHRLYKEVQLYKNHQKILFKPVLEDISEDVAYRPPNGWSMTVMLENLFSELEKI